MAKKKHNNMNTIESLKNLVDLISCELERIDTVMEPEEYEPWFEDNLDQALDLLSEVKDLIGA